MCPFQSPDKAMASVFMGQAMDAARLSGNNAAAIQLMNRAIEMDPTNGVYYHNRGMVNYNMGCWRDAINDFSRAISLSPHPTSYEQRGLAYYQMGQREAAREDWCQALLLNPLRTFALINLGWLAIEDGRFNMALDYCTWAIKTEPTNAKAYENRARAYFEIGDMVSGYADMQRCRELIASGVDTSNRDMMD